MLVRVLGEVSLLAPDGSHIPLPGNRQPALLAALAARPGQLVSASRLVHLLWGDSSPENPSAALHSAVFKLRANLTKISGRDLLVTREGGYLLQLPPADLDAAEFDRLVESARDLPPAEAAAELARALDLWRGPAYGAFADTEIAQLEALRLEELRRTAIERQGVALLAAGRPAEAVTLLQPFVTEYPLRETARICLMRALHADGRTAEGLEHYQQHRAHLGDELGLEPSPALKQAQTDLLRSPEPAPGSTTTRRPPHVERRGLQGMQVQYLRTATGNILAYGTTGQGAKLVVLLGWISSLDVIASARDPRSSLLERLTGSVSLTLFDRAGTGLSPGPVADYGLEASIVELTEIVRAIGPPVSLLAMSAAGPIAVGLAHRRPEWVDSLVLFGTFANAPATFTDQRLRDMVVEITRTHWGMGSKILADLYRPGLSDEAVLHLAKVFRDSSSPEVAASYLESLYRQDVSHLLPLVTTPALVLHYRHDRLIPFHGGRELASGLPNATFLPLDGHVHLPDVKDLDLIQDAIVTHVGQHSR
ncbi:MAG: BTAD domain-containing putative transcriptional regulator [Marmoricola sp.]